MSPVALLAVYCLLVLAASLLGGWIPLVVRLTHRRMEVLLSFVSGVMLGVALLHLLPHAWLEQAAWTQRHAAPDHDLAGPVVAWLLAGFLAMFFAERFFCFHHHDARPRDGEAGPAAGGPPPERATAHRHELTWTGAAIGLTLHSLTAGVALAAAVTAQVEAGGAVAWTAGGGTFLAVVLHKPFDSLTLGTLMAAGGRPAGQRHAVNLLFALAVPVGAALFFIGAGAAAAAAPQVISAALAFSAGTFMCISLSDLLPELQFHQHDRIKLSAALLLGVAVAWGAARFEARAHEASLDAARPADILIGP